MALATAVRKQRGILVAALLTALVIVSAASALAPSFTWNLSSSLPRGLYHLDPAAPPTRGAIVSFQPPAPAAALIAARAYLPPSATLLKVVVALPGDGVCIDDASFTVNGRFFGAVVSRDSAGRALVPFRFCGAVPDGQAFVATRARLSFDSRYFGPVPVASLTVAVPLWTY